MNCLVTLVFIEQKKFITKAGALLFERKFWYQLAKISVHLFGIFPRPLMVGLVILEWQPENVTHKKQDKRCVQ